MIINPQERFKYLANLDGPILITGHTGFKGTWMSFLLDFLGIEWIGVGLEAKQGSLAEKVEISKDPRSTILDIKEFKKLKIFFDEFRPSAIVHLAAESLVLESYLKPLKFFETNVLGTANLLEVSMTCSSVKCIGVVTTDKVYQNQNLGRRFVETDPLEGKDPYSSSKVGTESVIMAYQNLSVGANSPKILALRAGNVIGGGDFAENRLIPDLVRSKVKGEGLNIRNPASTRPWQHVLDPLLGYLAALDWSLENKKQENFNFGPIEASLRVEEVVRIAGTIWPDILVSASSAKSTSNSVEFEEAKNLDLDPTKSIRELSWSPRWNQVDATKKSINWWQEVLSGSKTPQEAIKSDLLAYFNK